MSTELATTEYGAEQIELIKRTICKGATNDELALFIHQCKRTGLDPFARQVHAVKRWDSKEKREVMTIQTGIDGYRLVAERTGKYAGNDDPVYDVENAPHPGKATVTVWKMVDHQRVPFTRSARWAEFVQTTRTGEVTRFWAKMPYLMLGKVAEALALRAAFPQELSGIYTSEEMGQADSDAGEAHDAPRAALPAGGQHEAPKPTDGELVNTLEKTLRECRNQLELKAVMAMVAQNKAKLTAAGADYLRGVCQGLLASLPDAVDEPGSNDDVDAEMGDPVAAAGR